VIGARQAWVMQLMSNDERPLFALEIGNLNVSSGSIVPVRVGAQRTFNRPRSTAARRVDERPWVPRRLADRSANAGALQRPH
jgi:hypothetical protein